MVRLSPLACFCCWVPSTCISRRQHADMLHVIPEALGGDKQVQAGAASPRTAELLLLMQSTHVGPRITSAAMLQVVPEAAVVTDSRKLASTASSAPPVDLRRLLGYVGEDPLGGAADSRPVSAEDEARRKFSCKLACVVP